jgi:hypothetical protein
MTHDARWCKNTALCAGAPAVCCMNVVEAPRPRPHDVLLHMLLHSRIERHCNGPSPLPPNTAHVPPWFKRTQMGTQDGTYYL